MIDKTPYEASYTISRADIKLTAAALFLAFVIAGVLSQSTADAATSGQSAQDASPQSERPAAQSDRPGQTDAERPGHIEYFCWLCDNARRA